MVKNELLPANSDMGAVTLWVADLELMLKYYRDVIGLKVLSELGNKIILGHENRKILILEHKVGLKKASPSDAGLFHTAILFQTQASLAKTVYKVIKAFPASFTGSADHLVSKAFYFNDPEGNGVELYWDRDRSEWSWVHGSIEMDTIFLDPNLFLKEHLSEESVNENKKVGHVHLCVGSIPAAEEFYVKMLGFEKTLNWGNAALFVSAGGYHHHMAMNTWRSKGAGKRQLALGLGSVEIILENQDQILEVKDRLDFFKHYSTFDGQATQVEDPWGNLISIKSNS
jgi:catechol 2,3-dioxygenase